MPSPLFFFCEDTPRRLNAKKYKPLKQNTANKMHTTVSLINLLIGWKERIFELIIEQNDELDYHIVEILPFPSSSSSSNKL